MPVFLIPQFLKNISLGRFLVSISLAVIVWGYVIATQYPEKTLPPFEQLLPEPPTGSNLELVPVGNQARTVKVTVSGQADKVEGITGSQVRPFVDLADYTQPGNYDVPVKLKPELLPDGINYVIEPKTIAIRLEAKITRQIAVEVIRDGEVNPDYFLEGEVVANPNQITIQGRQSLVDQVSKAQVPISLNGRVGTLRDTRQVQLVDSRSQRLPETGLTITPATVTVSAVISSRLATRTVPIRVTTRGEPATGYIAGTAKADPVLATLTSGNIDQLNQINFVETEPVNISGASSEVADSVQLMKIPNVTFLGNDRVQIKIGIVPFQASKTISVPLEVQNEASNLRYVINPENINLTLSGPYQAFQPELPLDKIKAVIDVQGRTTGTYTIPVQVELPSDLVVTNVPTVNVVITRPVPVLVAPTATPRPTATSTPTHTRTPLPVPTTLTATGGPLTPGAAGSPVPATTGSLSPASTATPTRTAGPGITPTVAAIGADQISTATFPATGAPSAGTGSPSVLNPAPHRTATPTTTIRTGRTGRPNRPAD